MKRFFIIASIVFSFLLPSGMPMVASAAEYTDAEAITAEVPQTTVVPEDLDLTPNDEGYIPVPDFPGFTPDLSLTPPAGTGTVVDTSDSSRNTEFFTIMTPEGNTFYLVIDRRQGQENVFFLNAVTEMDLFALTGLSRPATPQNPANGDDDDTPLFVNPNAPDDSTEIPDNDSGNDLTMHFVVLGVAVVLFAVAGWYFKVYKPKRGSKNRPNYDVEYEEPDYDDENEE